jgi:hypothetical protein
MSSPWYKVMALGAPFIPPAKDRQCPSVSDHRAMAGVGTPSEDLRFPAAIRPLL